jgi:NADH dehydrogenase FAD-containing subunit
MFNTIQDAQRIAKRISDPSLNDNIVIAGGGATGVELAGEIGVNKDSLLMAQCLSNPPV